MKLNRRHKAGLFLVLVATGLSLFFEASAKQTAGIVLLGVAATWLFGSVSLRVLGFGFSSLACVVGLCMAILLIVSERNSYLAASAGYDLALGEIRAAVARAVEWEIEPPKVYLDNFGRPQRVPRPPKGFELERLTPQQFAGRIRAKYPGAYDDLSDEDLTQRVLAKYPDYGDMVSLDAPQRKRSAVPPDTLPADWFTKNAPRVVQIPAVAQKWLRPGPWRKYGGEWDHQEFAADATDDAIMAEFQAKHLLPRPSFSIAAAIRSHRAPFLDGVVLVAAGLLGFAGVLWTVRRSKRAASFSAM